MAEKRSWTSRDSRPHDHTKQHKKQRPSNGYPTRPRGPTGPTEQVPQFTASEVQAALLPLLDHLIDTESENQENTAILQQGRALYNLLSRHASQSLPSHSRTALDRTRSQQGTLTNMPPYHASTLKLASTVPPLPPISEPHLKTAVFQHRSILTTGAETDELTYERLEFLGDAYIEIISTRIIFTRFPDLPVGQQAQLRESMVRNEKLAEYATAYSFGARIVHTGNENKEKGWTKILADVFEAYVAAVILSDEENGFRTAESWLTELWTPLLLSHRIAPVSNPEAKNDIARLVGAKGIRVEYRQERPMEFLNGIQKFFVGCYLTGWGYENKWLGSGEGQNKSQAGIAAAMDALVRSRDVLEDANRKKAEIYPGMKVKLGEKDEASVREMETVVKEKEKEEVERSNGVDEKKDTPAKTEMKEESENSNIIEEGKGTPEKTELSKSAEERRRKKKKKSDLWNLESS